MVFCSYYENNILKDFENNVTKQFYSINNLKDM